MWRLFKRNRQCQRAYVGISSEALSRTFLRARNLAPGRALGSLRKRWKDHDWTKLEELALMKWALALFGSWSWQTEPTRFSFCLCRFHSFFIKIIWCKLQNQESTRLIFEKWTTTQIGIEIWWSFFERLSIILLEIPNFNFDGCFVTSRNGIFEPCMISCKSIFSNCSSNYVKNNQIQLL